MKEKWRINVIKPKKIYLSHTKMDTYDRCPYRCYLKYIEHIEPVTDVRWPLVNGVALHELVEAMYNNGGDYSKKWLLRNWPDFFDMAVEKEIADWNTTDKRDTQLGYGYGLVSKFYDLAKAKNYLRDPISAEWNFEIHVDTFCVRGKVDLIIDDQYFTDVLDFKTGFKVPDQKTVDTSEQLTIYDWAVSVKKDFDKVRLGLVYPRQNTVLYSTRTSTDHDKFLTKAQDIANKIRNDVYPPTLGYDSCNYCELKHACKHYLEDSLNNPSRYQPPEKG